MTFDATEKRINLLKYCCSILWLCLSHLWHHPSRFTAAWLKVPTLPRTPSVRHVHPVNHPVCDAVSQLGEVVHQEVCVGGNKPTQGLVPFFKGENEEHDITLIMRLTGARGRPLIVFIRAWAGRGRAYE